MNNMLGEFLDKNFLIQAQGLSFERSGRIIFSSVNLYLEEGQFNNN